MHAVPDCDKNLGTATRLTHDEIAGRLCELAADIAAVDPAEVTLDTHLESDLNYDSLDLVEYAVKIEEAFDVDIPDEVAQEVRTVRQAFEALMAVTGQRPPISPPQSPLGASGPT